MERTHVDLGCGAVPRNPYLADKVVGLDFVERCDKDGVQFIKADLTIDSLPFEANSVDTISAYDFFEHIPRVLNIEGQTKLPFVNLMSEVYRVLKPGGKLYAVTPLYPARAAFSDPTHTNFITNETHKYFVEPTSWASIYGFEGGFDLGRIQRVNFNTEVNLSKGIKKRLAIVRQFFTPHRKQHIVWELYKPCYSKFTNKG